MLTEPNPTETPWLEIFVVLFSAKKHAACVTTLGQFIEDEIADILFGETNGDYHWLVCASLDEGEAIAGAARCEQSFPDFHASANCRGLSVVVFSTTERTVAVETLGEFLFEAGAAERIVFAHPDPAIAGKEAERWRQDVAHRAL